MVALTLAYQPALIVSHPSKGRLLAKVSPCSLDHPFCVAVGAILLNIVLIGGMWVDHG